MCVLFYVKSSGPSQLVIPLIRLIEKKLKIENYWSLSVFSVIAEGPAVSDFEKAKIPLYFAGPPTKIPHTSFSFDAACDTMSMLLPDVFVVAPNGNPPMSENVLIEAAKELEIPVVWMEDFWGNSSRLDFRADLYLVLDEYALQIVRERLGEDVNAVIMGNHAASKVTPSSEACQFMDEVRKKFDHVFCFLGGGPNATDAEILLLNDSLLGSDMPRWCVIPRFHPGGAENVAPSGETWGEVWRKRFAVLGDRIVFADHLKTEEVVVLSDVTFGGNSTDFAKAICAGKRAISLFTEETRQNTASEIRGGQVPMVALGLAKQITEPTNLRPFLEDPLPDTAKLKPFDPAIAYEEIKKLVLRF